MTYVDLEISYYLSPWSPAVEGENRGEPVLVEGGLGEHAPGLGSAAGGGVDQHALLDVGELGQEFAHGQAQAVVVGFAAHEMGELQGQDTDEQVHPDVVVGPVVHRGEGHHV